MHDPDLIIPVYLNQRLLCSAWGPCRWMMLF